MKSKFATFFLVLVFTLYNLNQVFGEEFIFEVSDLEITENGNIYKGNNRGTIRTDNQLKLISNNFEYLKKINRLEANGDVKLFDLNNDITINAQQIFYFSFILIIEMKLIIDNIIKGKKIERIKGIFSFVPKIPKK